MLMVVLACKILLRGSDKAVTIVGHIGRVFLGICSRRVVPAGFVAIDWSLRQRGHDLNIWTCFNLTSRRYDCSILSPQVMVRDIVSPSF